MFVVMNIESGKYFKRGSSRWDSDLVDLEKATVFHSTSGILNCLGSFVKLDKPVKQGRFRTQYSKRVLDTTKWRIIPISVEIDFGEESGQY